MRTKSRHYAAAAAFLGFAWGQIFGAWSDKTAGLPSLEYFSAQKLGSDNYQWTIAQDKLGRLFVGGMGLIVYDGQNWTTHPIGSSYAVRTIQFGDNNRIWVGGANEIGYVDEPALGDFKYHSLLDKLPESERPVGEIWGSGMVGTKVYFMGREKLFCWDGTAFRIWPFPSQSRLFPLKLGNEIWFQHLETGLYRLTETGPKLEIDHSQLPNSGILGLSKDSSGLLLASSQGFYRPGAPPRQEFSEELNRYIIENRLASYATMPDGTHMIGTVNGGLAVVGADGQTQRILDTSDGLPSQAVYSITVDPNGDIWCTTVSGIFRMEAKGWITLYNARNGLNGGPTSLAMHRDRFYVSTPSGVFSQLPATGHAATFAAQTQFKALYTALFFHGEGLLMGRHGGLDYYDGSTIRPIHTRWICAHAPSGSPSSASVA